MSQLNTFIKQRPRRIGVWLPLFMLFLFFAGATDAMAALSDNYNFNVTKQDIFCKGSAGGVRVKVTPKDAQTGRPNGSFCLRDANDNTVANAGDQTISDGTASPWDIRWYNLAAGTYRVYFLGNGGTQPGELLSEVTVESKIGEVTNYNFQVSKTEFPPLSSSESSSLNEGSIVYTPSGNLGMLTYQFAITHSDGTSENKTVDNQAGAYTLTGLKSGDKVVATITDNGYSCSLDGKNIVLLNSTITPERTAGIKYYNTIFRTQNGTDCKFNNYVGFELYTWGETGAPAEGEDRRKMKEYLLSNAQISKDGTTWYNLEEQNDFTNEVINSLQGTLVLKSPIDFNEGDHWYVRYKTPYPGYSYYYKEDEYHQFSGTIEKFGTKGSQTSTFVLSDASTLDDDCNPKYYLNYYLVQGVKRTTLEASNNPTDLIPSYFFPGGTTVTQVLKKKSDGTYEDVTDKVKASNDSLSLYSVVVSPSKAAEIGNRPSYKIDLNGEGLGEGTYKLVYENSCSVLNATSEEITIENPAKEEDMNLSTNIAEGFNGYTSGIEATFEGTTPKTIDFKLERKSDTDGTYPTTDDYTCTFKGTPYLSNTEEYYTLHFPYKKEDVSLTNKLVFPDLPKGTYRLTVTDNCTNKTMTKEITISTVQTWNPKNTDGYKNGIKVVGNCDGNTIYLDYGESQVVRIHNMYYKNGSWDTYGTYNNHAVNYEWKGAWKVDNSWTKAGVQFTGGQSNVSVFDILNNEIENPRSSMAGSKENTYRLRYFEFPLPGTDVAYFKLSAATCDNTTTSLGMIVVEAADGYEPTIPVRYELYDATATEGSEGIQVTTGDLHNYNGQGDNPVTISTGTDASHIFANLPQGWYTVKAYNNVNTEDGTSCDAQVLSIYVSPAGLPNINVDGTEYEDVITKEYVEGQALTSKLDLPVSEKMYDVEWWNVTDPTNPTKLSGDSKEPVYNFTPTEAKRYVIEARTTFNSGTCEGSSGGTRKVVFDYTGSSASVNYWMGGTEGKETDFDTPSNWTANKVITNGEDLIFATVANYGTAAKANCVLPERNIRVNDLTNESDKALVVSPNSSMSVVGTITGYDTEAGEDKLLIKADPEGKKATGTFLVLNNDAANTTVYATVELVGWGHKLADKPSFVDQVDGSPTYGKTLYGAPFTWQQIGIPVETADATTCFKNTAIQTYSEPTNSPNSFYQKWIKVADLTKLEPFKVYQIAYNEVSDGTTPHIYTFKGKLLTSDRMLTMTRKAAEVTSSKSTNVEVKHYGLGQNIFANSYTGSISIANIKFPDEVEKTVYLYRTGSVAHWHDHHSSSISKLDDWKAGGWLSLPKEATTTTDLPTTIPAMQGFLLKFTPTETKVGDDVVVTLSYAQNGSEFIKPNDRPQRAPSKKGRETESSETEDGYLKILLSSENSSDVLYEIQTPEATDGFDNGWDGRKIAYGEGSLYAETSDGKMQVNSVPNVVGQTFSVNSGTKEESYELTVVRKGLSNGLVLKDLVTNEEIALDNDSTVYLFTANATNGANRFRIAGSATGITSTESDLQVNVSGSTISISGPNGPVSVDVYSTDGKHMASHSVNTGSGVYRPSLPNGMYLVVVSAQGKRVTRKMAIN
jgi:hypothetical protein